MAARTFAQINCSLLRSRKLQGVSHEARWVYLCTHLSQLSSFTGVFSYPAVLWERDADLQGEDFDAAMNELVAANLLEWSAEEELVRVVGCHRQRPPQNASWCVNLVADFDGLLSSYDDTGIILRAAAEFSVSSVARSITWKPDSPEIPKLRETIGRFLRATCQDHEEAFLEALTVEADGANKAVAREFDALLPSLSMYRRDTVQTPCRDRADIPRLRQDLDQDQKRDLDLDGAISRFETDQADHQAQASDLQRSEANDDRHSNVRPMASTKRSALAMGGRG